MMKSLRYNLPNKRSMYLSKVTKEFVLYLFEFETLLVRTILFNIPVYYIIAAEIKYQLLEQNVHPANNKLIVISTGTR